MEITQSLYSLTFVGKLITESSHTNKIKQTGT